MALLMTAALDDEEMKIPGMVYVRNFIGSEQVNMVMAKEVVSIRSSFNL